MPDGTTGSSLDPATRVRPISLSGQIALAGASAIAVGLLDAGLVQSGLAGARGVFQYVPLRLWIVAPLSWLLVAAVSGPLLFAFRRRWTGALLGGALFIAWIAVRLRGHPRIQIAGIVVGLIVVLALWRLALRWASRPRPRIAAAIVGAAVIALIAARVEPPGVRERATAVASGEPNVILVFLDTVRYDSIFDRAGNVHAELTTLSRLANESVVFTRAYAPSPWTLTSHLAAVTGLPVHELGVGFDYQIYERKEPTLAERFRQKGYGTAAVISNSFLNRGSGFQRGFDVYEQARGALDICRTVPGLLADQYWPRFAATVCNWSASEVTRRALAHLDDSRGPVFLTLNYMDAHEPYYVEPDCGGGLDYRAAVRCVDRSLAPIVEWRTSQRPTLVAIVGDHGEQFGEHGLLRHGNSMYVQLLHVPLLVRAPGVKAARVDEPASIGDLPSLLADVTWRSPADRPIVGALYPPIATREPAQWSAVAGSWHFIMRERGDDALYDLEKDPAEEKNLFFTGVTDPAIERLRAALHAMRRAPRPDAGKFRSLGYVH